MVSKTYPHVEIHHNSRRNQDAVHRPMKSCFSWWSIWRQGWVNQELLHTKCMGKLYWKENSPLKMMVCFCFQRMTPGLCERKRLETTQMRSTCVTLILHFSIEESTDDYLKISKFEGNQVNRDNVHTAAPLQLSCFCHVLSRHIYICIYLLYTYIFTYAYRQFPVVPMPRRFDSSNKSNMFPSTKSWVPTDMTLLSQVSYIQLSATRICWLLLVEWVTNYQTQTEPPEMC